MADWFIPPLAALMPSVRWYSGSEDVWLTFDDGPHPVATPAVLNVLREEGVRAMFFLLGRNVVDDPSLVRQIRDAGHVVGNHAYDHQSLWKMRRPEVSAGLRQASEAMVKAGGGKPLHFRPPYGLFHPGTVRIARDEGMETVLFSVNSWDFAGGGSSSIVDRVVRRVRPGDIVLFHDNEQTAAIAADVLQNVIRRLRSRGMTFSAPREP